MQAKRPQLVTRAVLLVDLASPAVALAARRRSLILEQARPLGRRGGARSTSTPRDVRYEASLTHQFHEQVESWVDARTGLPPPERALDALLGEQRLPDPDVRHATLPARLELALAAAHADLERRAAARAARLLEHGRRAHDAELERANDYYHAYRPSRSALST